MKMDCHTNHRSIKLVFFGLALLASVFSFSAKGQTPKAVFIIVDGVPGDVIEKLELPCLQAISKSGGFTLAHVGGNKGTYNETPTISAPGYNNVITGVWGNKHNVWDNNIAAPNYSYWNIFRIAKIVKPQLTTGVFSTWKDNRTKLIGEGLPAAGGIKIDYVLDGLEQDTLQYPHDKAALYIHNIDEAVSNEAAKVISEHGPDLSWVYLEYTDDMGHRFGNSPQFYDAIKTADKQVEKIWKATTQREKDFKENWLLVITTDHGRTASDGKGHGKQSDRERQTWIVTNGKNLNAEFKRNPGSVDILPSILRHLSIPLPEDVSKELDGIPFIDEIDIADLTAQREEKKITLYWKNLSENMSSTLEVFDSETNLFQEGGKDTYKKIGEAESGKEIFSFTVSNKSKFHKVLIKAPHHNLNTWVTSK